MTYRFLGTKIAYLEFDLKIGSRVNECKQRQLRLSIQNVSIDTSDLLLYVSIY